MSGRIHRQQRKLAGQVAQEHTKILAPAVKAALDNSRIAIDNETLTRQRVERLEAVVGRSFIGRFRWLLSGR